MQHPKVLVLGYSEAAMLLQKSSTMNIQAIIAIHGQREYPVETAGIPHSLLLYFDDTEAPSRTDPLHASRIRLRQREAAQIGLTLTPPTIDHAEQIIDFARSISQLDGILLCQCQGGISRSSAAALLCLATWTGPGQEQYCVEQLLSVRACAAPHRDLVTFGDEFLDREGKLLEALDQSMLY